MLFGKPLQHWGKQAAGSAPFGPEINKNRHIVALFKNITLKIKTKRGVHEKCSPL